MAVCLRRNRQPHRTVGHKPLDRHTPELTPRLFRQVDEHQRADMERTTVAGIHARTCIDNITPVLRHTQESEQLLAYCVGNKPQRRRVQLHQQLRNAARHLPTQSLRRQAGTTRRTIRTKQPPTWLRPSANGRRQSARRWRTHADDAHGQTDDVITTNFTKRFQPSRKGVLLSCKRSPFDRQKESFWIVKVVLLQVKRATFFYTPLYLMMI